VADLLGAEMAKADRPLGAYNNVLLSHLSRDEIEPLASKLERTDLKINQVICEPGQMMRHAYFVEVGMVSVVSIMKDGRSIEVGTIGSEGVVGALLLLSTSPVPYKYFVQLEGHGHRISAESFLEAASQGSRLRKLVSNYQVAFLTQTMQTAACNGLHSVHERCCRWILMSHDRADGETFSLTHEFLSLMLGVRRASVSEVLQPIQERGWIRSTRGSMTVLDRTALEAAACECYGLITEHHRQLLD
jgi:CRP-like cAMP-binding protein